MLRRKIDLGLLSALVLAVLGAAPATAAPPPPVPWTTTGTVAARPDEPPAERVERRRFSKANRLLLRAGFSYLSRGDYYANPGVSLEGGWYPFEFLGVDVVSATVFFPSLGSAATALREQTGLLPDSQRLRARITTGGRFSFAYGKALVELLGTVVHFDASLALHGGVMLTEDAVNFVGDTGLGVQVMAYEGLLIWAEASVVFGYEDRVATDLMGGVMGTLGVGWAL